VKKVYDKNSLSHDDVDTRLQKQQVPELDKKTAATLH